MKITAFSTAQVPAFLIVFLVDRLLQAERDPSYDYDQAMRQRPLEVVGRVERTLPDDLRDITEAEAHLLGVQVGELSAFLLRIESRLSPQHLEVTVLHRFLPVPRYVSNTIGKYSGGSQLSAGT